MSATSRHCGHLPAIQILNLRKSYGTYEVLRGIDLTIPQGSYTTFLGPSGSGKTTLLKVIAGFADISSGSVLISGEDVTDYAPCSREIGIVFQNYALFPHLNARENVEYPLKVRKIPAAERKRLAGEFLERVHLSDWADRYPGQLSGGQQQRVALARSLAYGPKLLLLDEPLSALDKHLRGHMQELLKELQEELGISFVHVTHDQTEALALSSQVVIMRDGKIEQVGSALEIYREPTSRFVADFMGNSNIVECLVTGKNGRHATIKLGGAITSGIPLPSKAEPTLDESSRCLLLLRPENAQTHIREDVSLLQLSGPVLRTSFMGTHYEVVIASSHGDITAHLGRDYARGERVNLIWRANDTVLLGHDQ